MSKQEQTNKHFQHIQLPKGPCLLLYETSSIAQGFLSVNHLLKQLDIHVLESSPIAPGRLMVLANPALKDLEKGCMLISTFLKDHLIDLAFIEQVQRQALLAFYGLVKAPLQDLLFIVEADATPSLVKLAHHLNEKQIALPIEVRSSRGLAGKSLLFATLKAENQSDAQVLLKSYQHILDFAFVSSGHSYWHSLF